MKALVYIRVSTKSQHAGVKAQLVACLKKATDLGISNTVIVIDKDVSHTVPLEQREGLAKALKALKQGDVFITSNQDRISRNTLLKARFFYILKQLHIAFVTVLEDSTPVWPHVPKITQLYSERDIDYGRQQTHSVLAEKKARCEITGTIPYGFKRSNDGITLAKSHGEQALITLVRKLSQAGYSLRAIQQELASKGWRTRKNTPCHLTQIARILKNIRLQESVKQRGNRIAPYGFKYIATKLEECPDEQRAINIIQHLRTQKFTLSMIVQEIHTLGYRGRTGNPLGISQIHKILTRKSTLPDKHSGTIPYGFTFSPAKKCIEPLATEQEVISRATELRKSGYSLKALAQALTHQGYTSRKNTPFTPAQVARMISLPPPLTLTLAAGRAHLPYGLRYVSNTLQTELCPDEQKLITLVQELRVQGLSLRQIVDHITNHNYRTRVGTLFYVSQIARMLKRYPLNICRSSYENPQSTV